MRCLSCVFGTHKHAMLCQTCRPRLPSKLTLHPSGCLREYLRRGGGAPIAGPVEMPKAARSSYLINAEPSVRHLTPHARPSHAPPAHALHPFSEGGGCRPHLVHCFAGALGGSSRGSLRMLSWCDGRQLMCIMFLNAGAGDAAAESRPEGQDHGVHIGVVIHS